MRKLLSLTCCAYFSHFFIAPSFGEMGGSLADMRAQAQQFLERGQMREAERICQTLKPFESDIAWMHDAELARTFALLGDEASARRVAARMFAENPMNADACLRSGEIATVTGPVADAEERFVAAAQLRPDSPQPHLRLGFLHAVTGRIESAIDAYWKAWRLAATLEDKRQCVKPLMSLYRFVDRTDELETRWLRETNEITDNVAAYLALIEYGHQELDERVALETTHQMLRKFPEMPDALRAAVDTNASLHRFSDAIRYARRLAHLQPSDENYLRLAELLSDAGRDVQAVKVWTTLIRSNPSNVRASIAYARLRIEQRRNAEAVEILDDARKTLDDSILLANVGLIYVGLHELDRARECFERILAMPESTGSTDVPEANWNEISWEGLAAVSRFLAPSKFGSSIKVPSEITRTFLPAIETDAQARFVAFAQWTALARRGGRIRDVVNALETKTRNEPKNLAALERLFHTYRLLDETASGFETLKRLHAAAPENPTYLVALVCLGADFVDATTLLELLAGLRHITPEFYCRAAIRIATNLSERGQVNKAKKLLMTLNLANVPESEMERLSTAWRASGDTTQSELSFERHLRSLVRKAPVSVLKSGFAPNAYGNFPVRWTGLWEPHPIVRRGVAFLQQGDVDRAFATLLQALVLSESVSFQFEASPSDDPPYYAPPFGTPATMVEYPPVYPYWYRDFFALVRIRGVVGRFIRFLEATMDDGERRIRRYAGIALAQSYCWIGETEKAKCLFMSLQNEFPFDLRLTHTATALLRQAKDFDGAMAFLSSRCAADPLRRPVYFRLMLSLGVNKEKSKDMERLDIIIRRMTDVPLRRSTFYGFAALLYDYEASRRELLLAGSRQRNDEPNPFAEWKNLHVLVETAQATLDAGYVEQAISLVLEAKRIVLTQAFPDQREAIRSLLIRLNLPADADELQAKRYAESATLEAGRNSRQNRITSESDVRAAIQKIENHIHRESDAFQSFLTLAKLYRGISPEKSVQAYERALGLRSEDLELRREYAESLYKVGRKTDVAEQGIRILKMDPYTVQPCVDILGTAHEAGRLDEVISLMESRILEAYQYNDKYVAYREVIQRLGDSLDPDAALRFCLQLANVPKSPWIQDESDGLLLSSYRAAGRGEEALVFERERLRTTLLHWNGDSRQRTHRALQSILKHHIEADEMSKLKDVVEEEFVKQPDNLPLMAVVISTRLHLREVDEVEPLIATFFSNGTKILLHGIPGWLESWITAYIRANGTLHAEGLLGMMLTTLESPKSDIQVGVISHYLATAFPSLVETVMEGYLQEGKKDDAAAMLLRLSTFPAMNFYPRSLRCKQQLAEMLRRIGYVEEAKAMLREILADPWGFS